MKLVQEGRFLVAVFEDDTLPPTTVIAACAERAGVSSLLTFNVAHFRSLVGPGIEVVTPSD